MTDVHSSSACVLAAEYREKKKPATEAAGFR
jgi:hypothetical protein